MQSAQIIIINGTLRVIGAFLLLSRRAHLLTTCKTGGGMPAVSCALRGGIAAAAAASRQCHSTCECCCHRLCRRQISCVERSKSWGRNSLPPLPPACANLPPAALPQRWTVRSHRPFSLLRKRNRKRMR